MMRYIKYLSKQSVYSIFKKYQVLKIKRNARKTIEKYISSHSIKKLHIGSGGNEFVDWLNSDLLPENSRIALIDVSKIIPIESSSFDYVYSEHVFEHLNFFEQLNYFRETYRILKPGGKMRIATPNFDFLIHLTNTENSDIEKRYLSWNMNRFLKPITQELGNKADKKIYVINNYFKDWGHQLIHNKSSFINLISITDFKDVIECNVGTSLDNNLSNLEMHSKMITEEFNLLETMVFEAVK